MRTLVPLASLLCLLAACSGELDAGTDPSSRESGINASGASGASGQAGSDSTGPAGTSGASGQAGEAGASQAGGAGQAGMNASGEGGSAGSAGMAPTRSGSLSFGPSQVFMVSGLPQYQQTPSASFFSGAFADTPANCTVTVYGSCSVQTCEGEPIPWETPLAPDAGTISFLGGTLSPVTLSRDGQGLYTLLQQQGPSVNNQQPLLEGGEMIEFTGGGSDVPAFSHSARAPLSVRLEGLPTPVAPSSLAEIDTTQDFILNILDNSEGKVSIGIFTGDGLNQNSLSCRMPATSPSLVIPAAALAKLKERGTKGYFFTAIHNITKRTFGDWEIYFALLNVPRDKNGALVNNTIEISLK